MVFSQPPADLPQRERLAKSFADGNFKVAYDGYRELALDPRTDPLRVGDDLEAAVNSAQRLGRVDEVDALLEQAVAVHAENPHLLAAAADIYLSIDHHGFIVAGEFERGGRRGGGKFVSVLQRDRARAVQLLIEAVDLAGREDAPAEHADLYFQLARTLLFARSPGESWRLQYLTDLDELPDYEETQWRFGMGPDSGAPVDADGDPIFYHAPRQLADAVNDGQRWRWALEQAAEVDPQRRNEAQLQFANFLHEQFGVQTMARFGIFLPRTPGDDGDESGTYALHTLGENETIARLAIGVRRFELPDEFNFIRIYQQIADDGDARYADQSLQTLAGIFENRRQYPRAAEYWRRSIERFGANDSKQQRLDQIVGNWGRFEGTLSQPAGEGASLEYRFRNGQRVEFEAHEILIDKLLTDVKDYLRSNPRQLDWQRLNIDQIGYRLVQEKESKYLGDRVAGWALELEPRPDHFDRRITVTTPLQRAGAYLLTATMADGNTSKIVVWLNDTAIVKRNLGEQTHFFVADAVDGRPLHRVNVEFFGYRPEQAGRGAMRIRTANFAEFTDQDGQIVPDARRMPNQFNWLIIARTPEGRLAHLGFTNVWYGRRTWPGYDQTKVYAITDRPVYRPDQPVKFKFWIAQARYDQPDESPFAEQEFQVELRDPRGDKVFEKTYRADRFGGFEGEYELPAAAVLGQYHLSIPGLGGGNFRVEEYKKPEFEVTVEAPEKPVLLGDTITATIKAAYYFGAPVTQARVKYKVTRTPRSETWYPPRPWDWLYGRGYAWFASDYDWYPGWNRWGTSRPAPFWWGRPVPPPEVVAEREVDIGPEGTVEVEIDTRLAKELHGDDDHRYEIMAEVVDQSRRTIVGTGSVLAARKPFEVFAWVDRGYYRTGETITAHFNAMTPDGRPVRGDGVLELLQIGYDEQQEPVETLVQRWELPTDEQGRARQRMVAAAPGQYRLSYRVTGDAEHTIEGGYLFTVIGPGFDGRDFRFDAIEVIPDRAEYQPGDRAKLLINTDRVGSTVALFVRPVDGVYPRPQILRLDGKSTEIEIEVTEADMPNFFVEAATISNGQMHATLKEIVIPPVERVLNVEIEPSADEYKPGEEAEVTVRLTDLEGRPFVGTTVLSVYDKALEYISGGSNVPEIKEFFWKWRRSHHPQSEVNLDRRFDNLVPPDGKPMQDLGIFGGTVPEEGPGEVRMLGRGGGRDRMKQEMAAAPTMARMDAAMPEAAPMAGEAAAVEMVQPTVRQDFADSALWVGSLETDETGRATARLTMPENLTAWKFKLWAMGRGTRVGQAEAEAVTRKNLLLRMQAPRFFVERDEVVLSANVHNYLADAKQVQVSLELDGEELEPLDETTRQVRIEADGEVRVDWRVKVVREGQAVLRMKALTDEESDAMQMTLPVRVHGMLKLEAFSGAIPRDEESATVDFRVPAERRESDSRLEVRYTPTLAGAMVDALPYMVDYPYGCTEQTLNRFLPTVITQRVLQQMGLDLKAIEAKRTNLNAQELGDADERAKGWKRFERNPVFDEQEVERMVKAGLDRLTQMQNADGGWGWFSGWGERSTPHMTALVVHGLQIAEQNDVAVVPDVLTRGVEWLKNYQAQQLTKLQNAAEKKEPYKQQADNLDAFVYMVLVDAGQSNEAMRDFLYRDRNHLAVYTKAMFGLALQKEGPPEMLEMILENVSQYLVLDDENQTAYLRLPERDTWWYWYGSEIEAQAYYLKLLARTDPHGPVASGLVKYLLNNRKHATYWNSTRDTSLAIEAMADYLRASGEHQPNLTVEVWLNGQKQKEVAITAENLFTFDNRFVLEGDAVETGVQQIELRKRGEGPLYFNAYLTTFTLEDHIAAAGLEVKVDRQYYRLIREEKEVPFAGDRGQALDQQVEHYRREPIPNLGLLESGDLVEIELVIESKNDYEYLVFEDPKAAGFEPVAVQSGYVPNTTGAYMELRDDRVSFFLRQLPRGRHSIAYRVRAEIPGQFSALPTHGYAMYAPELQGNSDELKVRIEDSE